MCTRVHGFEQKSKFRVPGTRGFEKKILYFFFSFFNLNGQILQNFLPKYSPKNVYQNFFLKKMMQTRGCKQQDAKPLRYYTRLNRNKMLGIFGQHLEISP